MKMVRGTHPTGYASLAGCVHAPLHYEWASQRDGGEDEIEQQGEDVRQREGDGSGGDFGVQPQGVQQRRHAQPRQAGRAERQEDALLR